MFIRGSNYDEQQLLDKIGRLRAENERLATLVGEYRTEVREANARADRHLANVQHYENEKYPAAIDRAEAAEAEIERLQAESDIWEKHSLVQIVTERNTLRAEVEKLREILNRIIQRRCATCRWFYRYTTDPCGDAGCCQHPSPIKPKRSYHDDDYSGSLVDEDTCDQWQHKDTEIATVLGCDQQG